MIIKKLKEQIYETYEKHDVSFVVMNEVTADKIWKESRINRDSKLTLATVYGYEVLISESLKDDEFRIG